MPYMLQDFLMMKRTLWTALVCEILTEKIVLAIRLIRLLTTTIILVVVDVDYT